MDKQKKLKELTHVWVVDEHDNLVKADDVTEQDKQNNKYYIIGMDEQGNKVKEIVYHVRPKKRRAHFKRYPSKQTELKDGTKIDRVVDIKTHCETVVHTLAKKLFEENKVEWLLLPDSILRTETGSILKLNKGIFRVTGANIEKSIEITDNSSVRFDIIAENTLLNKKLGIEIYVKHKVDEDKRNKLKQLDFSTIEIDLSELASEKEIGDEELEVKIIDIIRNGQKSVWVSEAWENTMNNTLDNIICIEKVEPSRFKEDGRYIMYKDKVAEKVPNCKYIIDWDGDTSSGNRNRYITETQCKICQRFIGYTRTSGNAPIVMCNQSDYTNRSLLCSLIRTLKLR